MSKQGSVPRDFVRDFSHLRHHLMTHIQGPLWLDSVGDQAALRPNQILFGAIQHQHHLRYMWFITHHTGNSLPELVSGLVQDVQKMYLPFLPIIYL